MTTPDYVAVTLSLFGSELDFAAVSEVMPVAATKTRLSAEAGELLDRESKSECLGYWQYNIRYEQKSLKEALNSFIELTGLSNRRLAGIDSLEKVRVGAFVAITEKFDESGLCEIFLETGQIKLLAEMGAEILIDVSVDKKE